MGHGQVEAAASDPPVRAPRRPLRSGVLAAGPRHHGNRGHDAPRTDCAHPQGRPARRGGEPPARARRRDGSRPSDRAGAHRLQDPDPFAVDRDPRDRGIHAARALPARAERSGRKPEDARRMHGDAQGGRRDRALPGGCRGAFQDLFRAGDRRGMEPLHRQDARTLGRAGAADLFPGPQHPRLSDRQQVERDHPSGPAAA